MKKTSLTLSLLGLSGLPLAAPADAQVTVNPAALDPAKPAPRPAAPAAASAPRATTARPAPVKPAPPANAPAMPDVPQAPPPAASITAVRPIAATPVASAGDTPTELPNVPPAPPPPPVLPAPIAVATRPAAPPGTVAISADAPGASGALPGGLRVTFGVGRSDMTPATADAVRTLARGGGKTTTFNVIGLAGASGDDQSAPRRLALARGLAIRALLINEGVASTRIYVRALGNNAEAIGTAVPDRADIALGTTPSARPAP